MELALTSTSTNDPLSSIHNGMIVDGVGHRAVCFAMDSKTNAIVIRNMISQRTTEKIYGWNSGVQAIKSDDYVAISSWCQKQHKIQLYRNGPRGLTPIRNWGGNTVTKILSRLPESIAEFLKPKGGGPSYLPTGYWRSKYDMVEPLHRSQIEKFLREYLSQPWFDFTVQEALKVPHQHLITDWNCKHVKPLPSMITNHEEFWIEHESDSDYLVYNSMVWVLIHADGTKEFLEPVATSGNKYVGLSRRVTETFTGLPKSMPKTVVKAIQINLGAYEKNERSYGARWFLYKR